MGARIVVLGTGLVGKAIAIDLHMSGHRVLAIDLDEQVLDGLQHEHGMEVLCADFLGKKAADAISGADLVMGAAPGSLGFRIMEQVIGLGKHMVDISFCPEDYMELDEQAREKGVTVVADMGVAPGLCNAMLGFHEAHMEVESYRCLVGGLPFQRDWPLEYKSSWSPMDCIEEYVRPARLREGGKDVVREALSDLETVHFEQCGPLEAWNSDGLRSLLTSYPHIPHMVEKTLRYPGTVDYLRVLRELGYFDTEKVEVDGSWIRPVDLTAALLFPRFKLGEGEGEFTLMQVEITGSEQGRPVRHHYDLYDTYDQASDTLSMSRCTGYTATGVAQLILDGMLSIHGVIPPEKAALSGEAFEALLAHLEARRVHVIKNQSK
jgi:lysine 6-dehydrogenase